MAHALAVSIALLRPSAGLLAAAVLADLAVGDPTYGAHPVRAIGALLTATEPALRAAGLDGYTGGVLLFVVLACASITATIAVTAAALALSWRIAWVVHGLLLYCLLALGDLIRHVWRIELAVRKDDLIAARSAVAQLVGRDTDNMDAAGCRRAAVESLTENLTDGFVSPVLWYVLGGLPGLVLFKVVSTMDSMVGYKAPPYLRFGWCGARLDDLMNYVPARLTWIVISIVAVFLPGCSGAKAWRVGLRQHGLLLGPNSGWSEAAAAGAVQRKLVGPIWLNGVQVTDLWIGAESDPPVATAADTMRAVLLVVLCGVTSAAIAVAILLRMPM